MHLVDVPLSEQTNNNQQISNKMGLVLYDSSWTAGVNYVEDADIPYEENQNNCADTERFCIAHR